MSQITDHGAAAPADRPPQPTRAGPLSHIPLFSRLNEAEQRVLFASMRMEKVASNQTIFWLGDRGDSFYMVNTGRVAITVPNERGEHVLLNQLGPGGFFGEISLLDGGPRTASARATQPTELYVLGRDDFHAFLAQRPDVAIEILTVMGQRQRVSTEALRGMKNPNVVFEQTRTNTWQKISDILTTVAASQYFTLFHVVWFGGWVGLNLLGRAGWIAPQLAFDPFPFGLLTMAVSLEAIFLSIFVMVSQNRQSEKDRLQIDLDYQVNLKAQTEIISLARRLDVLEAYLAGRENKPEAPT